MGCKTCFEKLFGVRIGPRGFRSGLPPPLIPGFVMLFFGIFFVVGGILLCILHQTYIVARHDQLYEADNYFLIAGVIALCLGVLIVFGGVGWCYHAHTTQAERIEDYKLRKGYSSENVNKYAGSIAAGSEQSMNRTFSSSEYPHGHRQDRDSQGQMSHMSYSDTYPYPGEPGYAPGYPHPPPNPNKDVATRISQSANRGFEDFKSFVKRNTEASKSDSPKRRPYSDRLSKPSQGYADDDDLARRYPGTGNDSDNYGSQIDEGEFDLAKTYIQNPSKYYAQEEVQAIEDKRGGYEVMPVDDPHRRHSSRGRYPGDVNNPSRQSNRAANAEPPNPAKRSSAYRYDKGRPHDSSQDSNASGNNPRDAGNPPKPVYRYDKGRPLDSSQDSAQSFDTDTSVSMTAAGAPPPAASNAPPTKEPGKEKATLVYNPKDGQWYYYYKGKPISKYDPNMKSTGPQGGPVYKYINGKPVLLPPPPNMP